MPRITKDLLMEQNSELASRLTSQLNENTSLKIENEDLRVLLMMCFFLWIFVIIVIISIIFYV